MNIARHYNIFLFDQDYLMAVKLKGQKRTHTRDMGVLCVCVCVCVRFFISVLLLNIAAKDQSQLEMVENDMSLISF